MQRILLTLGLLVTCATLRAQLTGTYSVGGANPDYVTITAAVNALMTQGANGNVTFNIRPGAYTGQYVIGQVPGSPGAITFKSTTNDATDVLLEYPAASTADNYIFSVSGTDNITFRALTFHPLGYDHARALRVYNNADQMQVLDCVFQGSLNLSQSGYMHRMLLQCDQNAIGTTDNPDDLHIDGCTFRNGYGAMDLDFEGLGGVRAQGLAITNNTLIDQVGTGIMVSSATGQIDGNRIHTAVGDGFVGVRTTTFEGNAIVTNNDVRIWSISGCTGLEISNTPLTAGNVIGNNMVYVNGAGDVWGLLVYNLWGMSIVHNSVLVAAGNAAQSYAFYELGGFANGQDTQVRNNIFANNTGGVAYNVDLPGNVAAEDHNCLFSTGPSISEVGANLYNSINAHQNGTGLGSGDMTDDPIFPIQPDLHLNHCTLDGAGTYLALLTSDIDNDIRSNPDPDMGADEFAFSSGTISTDLALLATDLPYTLVSPPGPIHNWNTGSIAQSINITAAGTYWCLVTDVNGCTYTVEWVVTVDFSTSVPADNNAAGLLCYPNPADDQVWLSGGDGPLSYTVLDARGCAVLQGSARAGVPIDVSVLPSGIYTMRFLAEDAPAPVRFIKR